MSAQTTTRSITGRHFGLLAVFFCAAALLLLPASAAAQPNVTINGPTIVYIPYGCQWVQWTSTVSGGLAPYSYEWFLNGSSVGTGTSYSKLYCSIEGQFSSFTEEIDLVVSDSNGREGKDSHQTTIELQGCNQWGQNCVG